MVLQGVWGLGFLLVISGSRQDVGALRDVLIKNDDLNLVLLFSLKSKSRAPESPKAPKAPNFLNVQA